MRCPSCCKINLGRFSTGCVRHVSQVNLHISRMTGMQVEKIEESLIEAAFEIVRNGLSSVPGLRSNPTGSTVYTALQTVVFRMIPSNRGMAMSRMNLSPIATEKFSSSNICLFHIQSERKHRNATIACRNHLGPGTRLTRVRTPRRPPDPNPPAHRLWNPLSIHPFPNHGKQQLSIYPDIDFPLWNLFPR